MFLQVENYGKVKTDFYLEIMNEVGSEIQIVKVYPEESQAGFQAEVRKNVIKQMYTRLRL